MTLQKCLAEIDSGYANRIAFPIDLNDEAEYRESLREICMEHGFCWREGGKTFSIPATKTKYVHPGDYETETGRPVSPFEVAGNIAKNFNKGITRRRGAAHNKAHFNLVRSPGTWHYYYATPCKSDSMAYVDLKSAYLSIYRRFATWDLRYYPGKILGDGNIPIPPETIGFLSEQSRAAKGARNGLVGIAGAVNATMYRPDGNVIETPVFGVSNYQFALLVLHTLQAIMFDTHRKFAEHIYYINTDGLICDSSVAEQIMVFWLEKFDMIGTVKAHGNGEVRGVGVYQVGDKTTGGFDAHKSRDGAMLMRANGIEGIADFLFRHWNIYMQGGCERCQ